MSPKIKREMDARPEVEQMMQLLEQDDLSPELKQRIRTILGDLADHDTETALLDLAELSRALLGEDPEATHEYPEATFLMETDEGDIAGKCFGPDEHGHCPWADREGHVPCGGSQIEVHGFEFTVARDSKVCPLTVMGITED